MKCRGCSNPITETDLLFVHDSTTQFELCDGWRLPFHLACCSEVCRGAVARRERDALAAYVPIVTEASIAELYPDAFQSKGTSTYVPPASAGSSGNKSKKGFPEPRRRWDYRPTAMDRLNEGRE